MLLMYTCIFTLDVKHTLSVSHRKKEIDGENVRFIKYALGMAEALYAGAWLFQMLRMLKTE